jgi:hypothetical protein
LDKRLEDPFYEEIARLIPELEEKAKAKRFWSIYRNSLHHWLTSEGWLSHDFPACVAVTNGKFLINPIKFSERILQIIEDDFSTFKGVKAKHAFPQVCENIPLTNDSWGLTATVQVGEGTVLPFILPLEDFKPQAVEVPHRRWPRLAK